MLFVLLLGFLVLTFIAMVMVIRYVMQRNLTDATAHLQQLSADYSRRQEELKQRLEESERQYQEQIARARMEADRIVGEARQEAESLRTKRLEEARLESERIVEQAIESRDGLRKELERAMEVRAVERACELIQEILPAELRRTIQAQLVEDLCRDGLGEVDRLKAGEDVRDVRVVSALPLTPEQCQRLGARLDAIFSTELALNEETDARLVAGLTITIGTLVLDGSLASKIRRSIRKTVETTSA